MTGIPNVYYSKDNGLYKRNYVFVQNKYCGRELEIRSCIEMCTKATWKRGGKIEATPATCSTDCQNHSISAIVLDLCPYQI